MAFSRNLATLVGGSGVAICLPASVLKKCQKVQRHAANRCQMPSGHHSTEETGMNPNH
jgi:hypothetical protein